VLQCPQCRPKLRPPGWRRTWQGKASHDKHPLSRRQSRISGRIWESASLRSLRGIVENCIYFFIATADASGRPDCSFKGGAPGFVRVTGPSELAFPDYDGNGMFKSLGNLVVNPHVGMLFIAMHGRPRRLRINGKARIDRHDALLTETVGAQLIVRVKADVIFPNCPRYIPSMTLNEASIYVPHAGVPPVEPAWKGFDCFNDVVPPRRKPRSD
jgi:uncharacterized protein